MAYKLKLLAASVMAVALTGCGSTTAIQPVDTTASTNLAAHDAVKVQAIGELPLMMAPTDPSLENFSEIKIQELKNTITDDFNKKMMIIDMECQTQKVDFSTGVEPPYIQSDQFAEMTEEAEQLLSDMADRMGENPDPSLQFAYEQEVARLKIEFRIAELEQKLSDIEFQKARELNKVDRLSSDLFECAARASEAKAEMERQLRVVELGQNVSNIYDPAIIELTNQLVEARYELDTVNAESFEGDWEHYSQPLEGEWDE